VALGLAAKKEIVAEISDVASQALSVAVAEYRGMEVAELTDLRVKAREQGVYLRVVRNTLAKRALSDSKFADLESALTGPLIYGFSIDAPGGAARLFKDFAKENTNFEIKAAAFEGALADAEVLATLPTYDEAVARLMMCMKEASAGKLARTIAAIRDQKEEAAA
jgi:large subunit ribosomal protein L10